MHSLLLLAAIVFSSDFPGGSGRAEWPEPQRLRLHVEGEADQDGRNRQANWYYFRLDGVAGHDLTIELTDLVGEYNYNPGSHGVDRNTHPVYSYDNRHWRQFPSIEWDEAKIEMRLRLRPARGTVWIAHVPPYTIANLDRLAADAGAHLHLNRASVGQTVEGREMPLWTISDPDVPLERKKTVWLMFRQHSWESGSSWAGDGAIRFLLSNDPSAVGMRREIVWKIFPMADPDGVERGGVRFNTNGYDLNRNWDAVDAALMPEIAVQRKAIADWLAAGRTIDLFLTLHNTETSEYLEGPAEFRALTGRFRRNLIAMTTFHPTRPEPRDAAVSTTPGLKGRMSVNQGLHAEFGIPAMLMEQMIAFNTRLGGFPKVGDRRRFGAGLVKAAWATVADVSSQRMADGRQWTTLNLNVDVGDSYCYGGSSAHCAEYGRLYTWESAQRGCRALGGGWRLPTNDEWREFAKSYGGLLEDSEGDGRASYSALLSGGSSRFDALLGGGRTLNGEYARGEDHGFYWTASESQPGKAWFYNFGKGVQALNRHDSGEKELAFSVRCIR